MALILGTAGSDSLIGSSGDDIMIGDPQQAGVFATVSSSATGILGNFSSLSPTISPDGQNVAFVSQADNLIADDTNFDYDIYVKNLASGVITRVSTSSSGVQANGASDIPRFTPDGQKILFTSSASNLVAGDTNGKIDLFMKDLVTGVVTRLSTDSAGQQSTTTVHFSTCPLMEHALSLKAKPRTWSLMTSTVFQISS
jgi:trimeric autotransporter adhesin